MDLKIFRIASLQWGNIKESRNPNPRFSRVSFGLGINPI
jgi:hypothetical protein